MATLASVINFARAQSQTDSNGLTDANGIIFANEALLDYRRRLIAAGVDASQVQEAYTDIVANTGTYLYPTDMFWLKAIEINYADTSAQNYVTALQVDVSNIPGQSSFSDLRLNAATNDPLFDDRGDWFEIFPTPKNGNSQGIRIIYFLEPTEYTSTADNIAYPESLDYRILGWRIASSYYKSVGKFEEAENFSLEYDKRTKDIISTLARGTQQPLQATAIPWTGWQF